MSNHKHSPEYGDYKLEEQRDENIQRSEENIQPCVSPLLRGYWKCTNGNVFPKKSDAIDRQYDIERGAV